LVAVVEFVDGATQVIFGWLDFGGRERKVKRREREGTIRAGKDI